MKKKAIVVILVLIIANLAIYFYNSKSVTLEDSNANISMSLSSRIFESGSYIPFEYTCDGESARLSFKIKNVPKSAKSLAIVMGDTDAPNGNFIHWTIWNISPRIREIEGDLLPGGALEGKNSAKTIGWVSPCPASGTHHYYFSLYALDNVLSLPEGSTESELQKSMDGHILETASMTALYEKITR